MGKHTNYNKMSSQSQDVEEVKDEVFEEVSEDSEQKEELISGTVIECEKLNVREKPNATAQPLCTIDVGAEVKIDLEKSTPLFYKVTTALGVEGYCMKQYIAVI